jgi:hypothetical protein
MSEQSGELYTGDISSERRLLGLRLIDLIEKYGHSAGGLRKTDELLVAIYVDGIIDMRRVLIKELAMNSFVVYLRDGNNYDPIYRFATNGESTDVFDMHDSIITDEVKLNEAIQLIIEAADTAQFLAEEKVDTFDIQKHAIDGLKSVIFDKERELDTLRFLLTRAENREAPYTEFTISIVSAWEDNNEQRIFETFQAATLKEAIKAAVDKFKKVNRRTDVQFKSFTVDVKDTEHKILRIPSEIVGPYIQTITEYDRVAAELDI